MKPVHIAALTAAAFAAAVGFWMLRSFDPNAAGNPFPGCIFRALTGYDCIGCGVTRMFHALAHFDLLRAFAMNPLAFVLTAISPFLIAWKVGWQPAALGQLVRFLSQPKLWLLVLPSYWIARNLPWPPFSWLAPGGLIS